MRLARLLVGALVAIAAATAVALQPQTPVWTSHNAGGSGTTEAQACAAALVKASAHARSHLGLNVGACRCLPAARNEPRQCRLEYEVLERKN